MKLIDRHQHEQQQHDEALVAAHEPARDQIDEPQTDSRIGQRHQVQRPVGEREDGRPGPRNPSHQRRMLGVAPIPCCDQASMLPECLNANRHRNRRTPYRRTRPRQTRRAAEERPSPLRCHPSRSETAFASARQRPSDARRTLDTQGTSVLILITCGDKSFPFAVRTANDTAALIDRMLLIVKNRSCPNL